MCLVVLTGTMIRARCDREGQKQAGVCMFVEVDSPRRVPYACWVATFLLPSHAAPRGCGGPNPLWDVVDIGVYTRYPLSISRSASNGGG